MKVLIADAINEKGIENLKEAAEVVVDTTITPEELANTIHEYEGIIVRSRTKLTKEVIDKADNLKIIARAGVGVDNIDLNAATEKGIMVVNSPESTSITVAEHTMGLLLSLARKSAIADKSVKEGKWEKKKFMGVELRNKTLGVIGMGRIGSQVVNRCKAFEMDAVAYDPYLPEEVAAQMGVELTDLETVLKKADFITIHVPLTPETKHLISTKEFEFLGFLPLNKKLRRQKLKEIENSSKTIIIYEAPHKMKTTLGDLKEILKDRKIVLARELTKIHEEFIRKSIDELLSEIDTIKGEMILIIEGNKIDTEECKNFEEIKKIREDGTEYWNSRELSEVLQYKKWENFSKVIDRAKLACDNSGLSIQDHFPEVRKMVEIGSNTVRELLDYELSRYACYLIVQNGDPRKEVIALGQTYFAIQTRKQEVKRLKDKKTKLMLNE